MTADKLFVGYEVGTGEKVEIPIWHILIAGTTQLSGKTTLLKSLAKKVVEKGYKVLVFDCKSNFADYEGFGEEVPICLRETTDSLTILSLLESIMSRKLTPQYATLSRVSEGAKDFADVLKNAEDLIENSRGFTQDCARTLRDLMKRLIEQTRGRNTTTALQLPHSINRITINDFTLEGQQMVIKTALEDAIKLKFNKLVIIIDEMSKFTPQRYRSACQISINHYVTQGAITEDFLWGGTQFLATTSKDAMKAMDVKILGRQSHDTECEHTLDLIPTVGNQKFTTNTIMQLKVGHFVVIADNWVKIVYTCPENAVKSQCMEVALGKREPRDLQYSFLLTQSDVKKLKDLPQEEVVEIEKQDEPTVEIEVTEAQPLLLEKPKGKFVPKASPSVGSTQIWQKFELLENSIEAIRQIVKNLPKIEVPVINIEPLANEFRQSVSDINTRIDNIEKSSSITENTTVEQVKQVISIRQIIRRKTVSDDTVRGKILFLASTGFFGAWHPLGEVAKAFEEIPWTANTQRIKKELQTLVTEGVLAVKQQNNKLFLYKLAPNVVFEESKDV